MHYFLYLYFFFFFNDTATTEIYTLSLHDALPIWPRVSSSRGPTSRTRISTNRSASCGTTARGCSRRLTPAAGADRKSTRLNSSHGYISYAVFCLKKKKNMHDKCTLIVVNTSSLLL